MPDLTRQRNDAIDTIHNLMIEHALHVANAMDEGATFHEAMRSEKSRKLVEKIEKVAPRVGNKL